MPDASPVPDRPLARVVSLTLRAGVLAAAVCCLIGALALLSSPPSDHDLAHFHGQPEHLTSPAAVAASAAHGRADALAQLGILLLIATPLLRVLSALVMFILERDRLYTAVTLLVAAILALGLARGL